MYAGKLKPDSLVDEECEYLINYGIEPVTCQEII